MWQSGENRKSGKSEARAGCSAALLLQGSVLSLGNQVLSEGSGKRKNIWDHS